MNRSLTAFLATALCCSAFTVMAADPPDTTNLGNSDTPQQEQQSDMTTPSSKPMHMSHMGTGMSHPSAKEMKMMDTDNDGSVSKDEFLAYEGQKYDSMHKDADGNVSTKGWMKKHMNSNNTSSSSNSTNN